MTILRLWPLAIVIAAALAGWMARGEIDDAAAAKIRATQAEIIARRQIEAAAKISALRSQYDDLMAQSAVLPSGGCGMSAARARLLRQIN